MADRLPLGPELGPPIVVRVAGTSPAPKGSKSAFVVWPKGERPRAVVTDGKAGSPGRVRADAWAAAVRGAALIVMAARDAPPMLEGPVLVRATFYLPRPASTPRWRWLAWQKPDLDKIERCTWDALSGVVWRDDAEVVEHRTRKVYAPPGATSGAVIRAYDLAEIERWHGEQHVRHGAPWPSLPRVLDRPDKTG